MGFLQSGGIIRLQDFNISIKEDFIQYRQCQKPHLAFARLILNDMTV